MTGAESILMIEDDAGHASLIERNIRRAGVSNPIRRCKDGTSAIDLLFTTDPDSCKTYPSIIFLDLNLPDMSGTDILRRIRQDISLHRLIVIVLTTTDDKEEINRCYDLGCNVYLTKPLHYQGFSDVLGRLGKFLSVVQSPEPARC